MAASSFSIRFSSTVQFQNFCKQGTFKENQTHWVPFATVLLSVLVLGNSLMCGTSLQTQLKSSSECQNLLITDCLQKILGKPTAVLFGPDLLLYNPNEITALKSLFILANNMCIPENILYSLLALKKKKKQQQKKANLERLGHYFLFSFKKL